MAAPVSHITSTLYFCMVVKSILSVQCCGLQSCLLSRCHHMPPLPAPGTGRARGRPACAAAPSPSAAARSTSRPAPPWASTSRVRCAALWACMLPALPWSAASNWLATHTPPWELSPACAGTMPPPPARPADQPCTRCTHGAVRKLQLRFRPRSLPMGYEPVQVRAGD